MLEDLTLEMSEKDRIKYFKTEIQFFNGENFKYFG